jgi:isoleucyl-tRNA synthetase
VKLQSPAEAAIVHQLAGQIVEELNVKALDVISDDAQYFEFQVRPNLPVLGPKYGQEIGSIQRALAAADKAAVARAVTSGRPVDVDGFTLQPDEVLVAVSGKPGYAVAEEAGYAVAVTTEVTQELADEGLARELVRRIQEMRKSAGFEIADRIILRYEGDPEVERVIETWRDYISQETLAAEVTSGTAGGYREDHEVDGRRVRLTVEKL